MEPDRYIALAHSVRDGVEMSVTPEELAEGYHFCHEFDGMFVGPDDYEFERSCTCYNKEERAKILEKRGPKSWGDMDDCVVLEPSDILWNIVVKKVSDDMVELSWGWDAGLTLEHLAELDAEDPNDPWPNPRGMERVVTSLEGAEELYRDLGILLGVNSQ